MGKRRKEWPLEMSINLKYGWTKSVVRSSIHFEKLIQALKKTSKYLVVFHSFIKIFFIEIVHFAISCSDLVSLLVILLVPFGVFSCLLVPIGAFWCLLVPFGAF